MNIQKHLFRTQAWFLQTVEVIKVIQRIFVINSWKCARLFSFVVSQGELLGLCLDLASFFHGNCVLWSKPVSSVYMALLGVSGNLAVNC